MRDITYETLNYDFDYSIVFAANPRSGSGRAANYINSIREPHFFLTDLRAQALIYNVLEKDKKENALKFIKNNIASS